MELLIFPAVDHGFLSLKPVVYLRYLRILPRVNLRLRFLLLHSLHRRGLTRRLQRIGIEDDGQGVGLERLGRVAVVLPDAAQPGRVGPGLVLVGSEAGAGQDEGVELAADGGEVLAGG